MVTSRIVSRGFGSLALCICASLGAVPGAFAKDASGNISPYGLFLAGQAAANSGQSGDAAALFARAAKSAAPDSAAFLAGQAFTAALLAGDVNRAAALAPSGPDADKGLVELGALVQGVKALSENKGKIARTNFQHAEGSAATASGAALLLPFAAAEAGDKEASVDQPVIAGAPVAQFFARLDQGKLFEHAHRWEEAETAYRSLIAKGDPGALASLQLGAMLERRGRGDEAAAIYNQALMRAKDDPTLLAARARALSHKGAPPEPSLRESAAEALVAPASLMVARKEEDVAMAYLRLALCLDPNRGEAWLLVGDVLAAEGDQLGARAAYLKPGPASPQFVDARMKLAWSYQNAGQKDQALSVAREALAAHPNDRESGVTLADLLRADERYDESAKVLDGLIAAGADHPDWRLLYMRAVDNQETGHWQDAETDLQRALKLRPDDPELLNFLGYSWIDRGEKLTQALAMVRKAVDLDPHSGAMIDSLGWGYYRLGDYKSAVDNLETAVTLEPADPDVNNHLGDAYWRVGRRLEARFQWTRVLSLEPSAKLKAEVETKLKAGLDGPDAPALVADQQAPHL
jgi:Flp pilus assembly protein TadD